jgi:hypothetical protein
MPLLGRVVIIDEVRKEVALGAGIRTKRLAPGWGDVEGAGGAEFID